MAASPSVTDLRSSSGADFSNAAVMIIRSLGSSSTNRTVGRSMLGLVQFHPEPAALARRRLQARRTAHPFDRPPDDRETNPRSGIVVAGMQPLEDLEEPTLVLRRDP